MEWVAISFSGAPVGEIRMVRLKSKGAPGHVHYQSDALLCKALLTARLLNCEPFRSHCSSDLNIPNTYPKDLSFGKDFSLALSNLFNFPTKVLISMTILFHF